MIADLCLRGAARAAAAALSCPFRGASRARPARAAARLVAGPALCLAMAQSPAAAADRDVTGEVFGVLRAVFLHEAGHGLIDVLGLPLVGPEEDVVDEFAAYMLIFTQDGSGRNVSAIFSQAKLYAEMAGSARRLGRGTPYYDEHSPSERRFFNFLCSLYGSDPGRYYKYMEEHGIPQNKARRCEISYKEKRERWLKTLTPHVRTQATANAPGFDAVYAPPTNASTAAVSNLWQQTRFLESVSADLTRIFALPRAVPVVGRSCGMANAFWDGRQITMCYEFHPWAKAMLEAGDKRRSADGIAVNEGAIKGGSRSGDAALGTSGSGAQSLSGALGGN